MIILDKPFVSELLQQSLVDNNIPVVMTPDVSEMTLRSDLHYISQEAALDRIRHNSSELVYSNSENAITWIGRNLGFTDIPKKINLFKDKVSFRELIRPLYPDYYFRSLEMNEFEGMRETPLDYPLILKPAVGFFSMGVHKIREKEDWLTIEAKVTEEIDQLVNLYPVEVFDSTKFILEACIPGREFAMDAYFDESGEPVILNIMEHYFSSEADVSDRLYTSSATIIRTFLNRFQKLLSAIGELAQLRNFPVHVEVRLTETGEIIPIEVNPMRFGGWCTTADLAGMAYGFDPYQMYFNQDKPDWDSILKDREDRIYNIVILDNSTGIEGADIQSFEHDKLLAHFSKVLDFRPVDYKTYPIFGFLFVETDEGERDALERVLTSDLREYIVVC
ncbi:MAG: ATP-grasp domain-containing protein [Bacteroidota bacterium]|nr:ATP-grasp domain-containing protein [Bacteroidota bacterium]